LQNKEELYFVKGALEKVLQQCTKYASDGALQPLNTKKEQDYLAEAYEIGRKGLRGKVMNMLKIASEV
jgi:Ca2+-transporting ATPase